MNTFKGKLTAHMIGLLTGRRQVSSTDIKPQQWVTLILSLLKMMKPHLLYFPHFQELGGDVYTYTGPHSTSKWGAQDWRENHKEKAKLAEKTGLPEKMNLKTRVIIVMHSWRASTDMLLTRDGQLFAFTTTHAPNGGADLKKYASASVVPYTKKRLLALLEDGNRSNGPYLFASLCSLVEEYKMEKERGLRWALELHSDVGAVSDRIKKN